MNLFAFLLLAFALAIAAYQFYGLYKDIKKRKKRGSKDDEKK